MKLCSNDFRNLLIAFGIIFIFWLGYYLGGYYAKEQYVDKIADNIEHSLMNYDKEIPYYLTRQMCWDIALFNSTYFQYSFVSRSYLENVIRKAVE